MRFLTQTGILASLIPSPRAHFLTTSYTPFTSDNVERGKSTMKTSVLDVMRRLLQPKNRMVNMAGASKDACYLSALNFIQGDADPRDVHKSLLRIRERNLVRFAPWGPASIQVALARRSPYVESSHRVSGLMLANHTGIAAMLRRTTRQYDKMMNRRAMIHVYEREGNFQKGLPELYVPLLTQRRSTRNCRTAHGRYVARLTQNTKPPRRKTVRRATHPDLARPDA